MSPRHSGDAPLTGFEQDGRQKGGVRAFAVVPRANMAPYQAVVWDLGPIYKVRTSEHFPS